MNPPEELRRTLRAALPEVALAIQAVPGPSGIRLWLLHQDASRRTFGGDAARRLAEAPPYWSLCWAAGLVSAAHLAEHPALARGKTIVDFGTGSGVVAIAAARAGAARVIALDSDPIALSACRANAALNAVKIECAASLDDVRGDVDLITVADVFYDAANLPLLPALKARAAAVLAADSRRRDLAAHGLTRFASVKARTLPDFGDPQFETVELYRG